MGDLRQTGEAGKIDWTHCHVGFTFERARQHSLLAHCCALLLCEIHQEHSSLMTGEVQRLLGQRQRGTCH
jgi:hypothetical protein